jgi:hypothetical protein
MHDFTGGGHLLRAGASLTPSVAVAVALVVTLAVASAWACALAADVHCLADIQKVFSVRRVTALECQCLFRIGSLDSLFMMGTSLDFSIRSRGIGRRYGRK